MRISNTRVHRLTIPTGSVASGSRPFMHCVIPVRSTNIKPPAFVCSHRPQSLLQALRNNIIHQNNTPFQPRRLLSFRRSFIPHHHHHHPRHQLLYKDIGSPAAISNIFKIRSPLHAISLSTLPFIGHFFSSTPKKTGISSEDYKDMATESATFPVEKSETEWRAVLSREQFRILRQKGTEAPYSGEYDKTFQEGTYNCAACNFPLYKSTTKFKSGCGWPAFYEGIPGAIRQNVDNSFGMDRQEIVCSNCGGHLGHVFKGEGYSTPTDERHCVNSVSLKLEKEKKEEKK